MKQLLNQGLVIVPTFFLIMVSLTMGLQAEEIKCIDVSLNIFFLCSRATHIVVALFFSDNYQTPATEAYNCTHHFFIRYETLLL